MFDKRHVCIYLYVVSAFSMHILLFRRKSKIGLLKNMLAQGIHLSGNKNEGMQVPEQEVW